MQEAAVANGATQNKGESYGVKKFIKTTMQDLFGKFSGLEISSKKYRPIFHELAPDFKMALADVRNYYANNFLDSLGASSAYDLFIFNKPWDRSDILITRLICDTYLLENGIAQGDRLSMANSVELRLPFVDYKLVELIIGLRKAYADNPDYLQFPKPWLRGAMKGILPDFIIDRPKQGFAPPVMEWHTELFKTYGHYLDGGF